MTIKSRNEMDKLQFAKVFLVQSSWIIAFSFLQVFFLFEASMMESKQMRNEEKKIFNETRNVNRTNRIHWMLIVIRSMHAFIYILRSNYQIDFWSN